MCSKGKSPELRVRAPLTSWTRSPERCHPVPPSLKDILPSLSQDTFQPHIQSLLPTSSFLRLSPLHFLFRNTPAGCSTHTYDQLWGWQTVSRAARDWWRQYLRAVESHDGTPDWGGLCLRASAPYSLSCWAHLGILSHETGSRSRTCSTEGEPQNLELRASCLFGWYWCWKWGLRGGVGSMAVHWCGGVCSGLQLVLGSSWS